MQLPNDIRTTFQQLCVNQQFLSNIAYYTKVGFQNLMTPKNAQDSQVQCPSPYLLAIAHCLSCGQSLQNLSGFIPQSYSEQFLKAVRVLQKKLVSLGQQNIALNLLNDHVGSLRDVKWEMAIQNGRQVWIVEMIIDNQQDPVVMKLNYQELSLFSFKINQVVGHVKSIDMEKIL